MAIEKPNLPHIDIMLIVLIVWDYSTVLCYTKIMLFIKISCCAHCDTLDSIRLALKN